MKRIKVGKPNEKALQEEFILPFFTRNESNHGLGYKQVRANTVSSSLIIESDLVEFLKESRLNAPKYKQLLKKFNGNEEQLVKELLEFLIDKILSSRNMATFLKSQTFSFKGIELSLFHRSGSSLDGDRDFNENIFSVVEELTYAYKYNGKKIFHFRPDISLFVNGIYLGYNELKSNYTNQTAKKNGKKKIKNDYEKAVRAYCEYIESDIALTESQKKGYRRDLLKVFEKAIWISTTDVNETYIIRDITQFFEKIRKNDSKYEEEIEKALKAYPLSNSEKEYDKREKLAEIFEVHFSKKMIEKEILYYNFIEKEVTEIDGKKVFKSGDGRLISPRPKQKFGVDKILNKIDEFLEYEDEPNYFLDQLKEQLKELPKSQRDKFIADRMKYQNNKNIYSLLLQYSAGFGKSNIIGWSALQLKDLQREGEYVYDKVIIVVDRLQLRDQIDTKMFNMNIDNRMYIEASSKETFHKALKEKERVIIANIQKFNDIGISDVDTLQKLANMRVVFLIDEIHRSNSGEQNEAMLNVFDELQNSFDKNEEALNTTKKNLIIGFTATPSEYTLARFGEFGKYAEAEKYWRPFDSYTMNEAINDGYILNPIKNILSISSKMYFELPDNELEGLDSDDVEKKYSIKKKKIYENEERIDAVSKNVAKHLVQTVYKKIGKRAKAMLAVSSIKSAKLYKEKVTKHFKRIAEEKKNSKNDFTEAPIYIVYSRSQGEHSSTTYNNGLTESQVLKKFANDKNALIIVVDKLQTGFDEPRLHTLFLDKEITGINAIQTICRVNRKTKGKTDCSIVDYSYKNINFSNIKHAFERFSDLVVSDFNPLEELKTLIKGYKSLSVTSIYNDYFSSFNEKYCLNPQRSINFYMDLEKSLTKYIKSNPIESKEIKTTVSEYFRILSILEYVIVFDEKYKEECFLYFFQLYSECYRKVNTNHDEADDVIISFDDEIGIVEPKIVEEKTRGEKGTGGDGTSAYKYDILKIIAQRNKDEEDIEEMIKEFQSKIELFYLYVSEHKNFTKLKAKIEDSHFSEDEVYTDFRKIYNDFKRRKKQEAGEFFLKQTKTLVEKLCDDFIQSMNK